MTTANNLPGAPFFGYRQGQLCAEDVRLADLAAEHGTPSSSTRRPPSCTRWAPTSAAWPGATRSSAMR